MSARRTRGEFLRSVGAGTVWIALLNTLGCEPVEQENQRTRRPQQIRHPSPAQPRYVQTFRSRPDLRPPTIDVTAQARDTAPGYIFVAPKKGIGQYGAMILDDSGQPVWFRPVQDKGEYAMNFKVQRYRGEPVLTWAEGRVVAGHGLDEYVILDSSYKEITRVRAGNGYQGDHHEFLITPQDTALLTIYGSTPANLSPVGGPKDGAAMEGIVQEVDIESGEVLFEWHSLDHVGLDESYAKPPRNPDGPFEYFHVNSIDVDHDSNLLVSGKGTFTVYKIERKSGDILWRLGGKKSDFEMGPGTRTAWQHDARRQRDGTITIFDNGDVNRDELSYGLVLEVDEEAMTATLVRRYSHPHKLLAATQGNVQVLPNDNVFIGWGSEPVFSEFSKGGHLLFDARFSDANDESYRAFRFPWRGQPGDDPAVAVERGSVETVRVYASWNGATEVSAWQVLAGPDPDRLKPLGSVPRDGFETTIAVRTNEPYVAMQAKHRSGRVLGASKAVKPQKRSGTGPNT